VRSDGSGGMLLVGRQQDVAEGMAEICSSVNPVAESCCMAFVLGCPEEKAWKAAGLLSPALFPHLAPRDSRDKHLARSPDMLFPESFRRPPGLLSGGAAETLTWAEKGSSVHEQHSQSLPRPRSGRERNVPGPKASAMAERSAQFVVTVVYILHGGASSVTVSAASRLRGCLFLRAAGVVLTNKMASARGDKLPNRTPDLRVTTDITRCDGAVRAKSPMILGVVGAGQALPVR
jgi:hypothetical protein